MLYDLLGFIVCNNNPKPNTYSGINLENYHESTGQFVYLKLNLFDHRSQDISPFFLTALSFIEACRKVRKAS